MNLKAFLKFLNLATYFTIIPVNLFHLTVIPFHLHMNRA